MSDPNIEALTKIASNGVEICGAVNGVSTLLGAVIVSINHYQGYTNKLLLIGVASLTCAAVVPRLIDLILPTNELAAVALGFTVCLPLVVGGFWGFFLPMRIALQGNRIGAGNVIAANLLIIIPFSWHLALWLATKPKLTRQLSKLILGENCPSELLSVRQHTERVLAMLEKAGEKKASARLSGVLDKHLTGDVLLRNYEQGLDRMLFDFELPDHIADEIRDLSAEIRSTYHEQ